MYQSKDQLPTPLGTLDDLLEAGDSSAAPYKVFVGHNLGNRTFAMTVSMHEFFRISDVANVVGENGEPVAQRKLDLKHATKLAIYILKGLVYASIQSREIKGQAVTESHRQIQDRIGRQPYLSMQPIVVNIRNCDPRGKNLPGHRILTGETETACFKVFLSQKHVLWVVDGQHRRKAMQLVFEFLDFVRNNHRYPKKTTIFSGATDDHDLTPEELQVWHECFDVARSYCTIDVEVHLGLRVEEERQLFHDLNNLGKKVEASLALQFDNSNPVNLFIKEVLVDDILDWDVLDRDIVNWQEDAGAITRKDLVAVNALLFLNKTNISGATPPDVDHRKPVVTRFWNAVRAIPHLGVERAKMNTVAAQPVVLKALAKLTYDFAFGRRKDWNKQENLDKLIDGISQIDFTHANPMWRYYELSPAEREQFDLTGLANYLPSADEGFNRDIGAFDKIAGVMRFGPKHNDIVPILGDMIRWRLGLPNRHDKLAEQWAEELGSMLSVRPKTY